MMVIATLRQKPANVPHWPLPQVATYSSPLLQATTAKQLVSQPETHASSRLVTGESAEAMPAATTATTTSPAGAIDIQLSTLTLPL